ncbi:MAG: hypothetical protein M3N14_09535 [Bacteroidota bacterium]|nr:hypothetical protein [Bacteroidota bacterium]
MKRILKRELAFVYNYYIQRKFRKLRLPNVSELITSEDASIHWKNLDVSGKVVLDLGCGFWEIDNVEESSPVYFKNKGAVKIIGVDLNANDINILKDYFKEYFKNDGSEFLVKQVTTTDDLLELIMKYRVESIKCDIEGFEKVMFNISKDQVANITSISVEYHSHVLFLNLINTLNNWGFSITDHGVFTYGGQNMGVLTAKKV